MNMLITAMVIIKVINGILKSPKLPISINYTRAVKELSHPTYMLHAGRMSARTSQSHVGASHDAHADPIKGVKNFHFLI